MEKLPPLLLVMVATLAIIGFFVLAIRWARKSSRRAAFLGWGLQFLGAGVNPVPPPQVQIEEVNAQTRIKKDAESGDPKEGDATLRAATLLLGKSEHEIQTLGRNY
jgi:hypothetical protein